MLLQFNNLCIEASHNNQRIPICTNISFSVNRGETVGILGESGSGKSVSALSILKILPPALSITSGEIVYKQDSGDEVNLTTLNNSRLRAIRGKEISMVFQEPMSSLNPVFTCGHQVLETIMTHFPKMPLGEAKNKVLQLFAKVKLPDPPRIFDSYPHQLSGGQKQRVMIAIAISCNPRLLIADEPTTALDVTVQKSILDLLKELQADMGMSILFITHDISVIAEIAQRILVFYKGEIVEQGEVKQILHKANHPYTQGLLACRSAVHKKGERLLTISEFTNPHSTKPAERKNIGNSEPQILLNVTELDVSFGSSKSLFSKGSKKSILKKINLEVYQGETLGLVGESGSGKTTLGRTIMKLIEAEHGNVFFKGIPVNKLSAKATKEFRKKVQIIFQDPYSSLNPKITIGEMIAEPLLVHNLCKTKFERRERVVQLLTQVGLSGDYYNRYAHQFSGGQRQRIGIARALAVEPELVILDESVSALDVSIQAQILNLLNDLKNTLNLTFIFISHDLNTVRYMSDRMVVLKNGEIAEEGTSEELFLTPKSAYTRELLLSIPGREE